MPITEDEEGLTSNRDFALVSGSVECYKVTGYIKQDMLATINTNFASVSLLTWKAGDDLHHTSGDLCNCDFQPICRLVICQLVNAKNNGFNWNESEMFISNIACLVVFSFYKFKCIF